MKLLLTISLFLTLASHAQTGKGVHIDSATGKWWTVTKPDTAKDPIKFKHAEDSVPRANGVRMNNQARSVALTLTTDTAMINFRRKLMKK